MARSWSGLVSYNPFYLNQGSEDADNCVVIVLIAAEIVVAAVNIVVDLYAGD